MQRERHHLSLTNFVSSSFLLIACLPGAYSLSTFLLQSCKSGSVSPLLIFVFVRFYSSEFHKKIKSMFLSGLKLLLLFRVATICNNYPSSNAAEKRNNCTETRHIISRLDDDATLQSCKEFQNVHTL